MLGRGLFTAPWPASARPCIHTSTRIALQVRPWRFLRPALSTLVIFKSVFAPEARKCRFGTFHLSLIRLGIVRSLALFRGQEPLCTVTAASLEWQVSLPRASL